LCDNDPDVVLATLAEAFEDNEAPAAPVAVDDAELDLVVLAPPYDVGFLSGCQVEPRQALWPGQDLLHALRHSVVDMCDWISRTTGPGLNSQPATTSRARDQL
jgi:hypothetical protein